MDIDAYLCYPTKTLSAPQKNENMEKSTSARLILLYVFYILFNLCFLGIVWDMIYKFFMSPLLHSCFSYTKLSADLCTGRGETTPGRL